MFKSLLEYILLGSSLELMLESALYLSTGVETQSFVKVAKKKYDIIPTMMVFLTALDIVGEQFKLGLVLYEKNTVGKRYIGITEIKEILDLISKRLIAPALINLGVAILSIAKQIFQGINNNQNNKELSIITTILATLASILSIIYSTKNLRDYMKDLQEDIYKISMAMDEKRVGNFELIKKDIKNRVNGKFELSKPLLKFISNMAVFSIYLFGGDKYKTATNALMIAFTVIGLMSDAKQGNRISLEDKFTLFLVGMNIVQLLTINGVKIAETLADALRDNFNG